MGSCLRRLLSIGFQGSYIGRPQSLFWNSDPRNKVKPGHLFKSLLKHSNIVYASTSTPPSLSLPSPLKRQCPNGNIKCSINVFDSEQTLFVNFVYLFIFLVTFCHNIHFNVHIDTGTTACMSSSTWKINKSNHDSLEWSGVPPPLKTHNPTHFVWIKFITIIIENVFQIVPGGKVGTLHSTITNKAETHVLVRALQARTCCTQV